jgi:hypothetical protein
MHPLIKIGIPVADAIWDLTKIVNRSPVRKNDRFTTLQRNEVTKKLDDVKLDMTKSDDVINALNEVVKKKRDGATKKEINPVANTTLISRIAPETTVVTAVKKPSLPESAMMKNRLIQESNDLLKKQIQQMELQNELMSAKIFSDYESTTAVLLSLENIARELKITREFAELSSVKVSDNMDKYFNPLASYFDFQNTGISSSSKDFLTGENENEFLKDSNNEIIKPREAKAKKDAEKAIETKAMNTTGFNASDIEDMFDSFDENPFTALIEGLKESMKKEHETMFPTTNTSEGQS